MQCDECGEYSDKIGVSAAGALRLCKACAKKRGYRLKFIGKGTLLDGYSLERETEGGCFVATVCYGSYECPEVLVLQRFRDDVLLSRSCGKIVVALYYRLSPSLAAWLRRRPALAGIVRRAVLDRLVHRLRRKDTAK